jgi:4-amino-4-deoxy-L-arabinose transferase-like glycosyltransferase
MLKSRSRYLPVLILLFALLLRLLVFQAILVNPERFRQPDSGGYHQLATNLLQFRRFGSPTETGEWSPDVNRMPGYPAFLAIVYGVFGPSVEAAILVQALLSTLAVALAYRLGNIWGGPLVGVLVATLASVDVGSVIYANQLMTETLFNCVFLAGMVTWSAMVKEGRWQYGLLGGLLLGLGTLVRPVLLYWSVVAGMLPLLYHGSLRQRVQRVLAIVLVFALVVAPWMVRNHAVTGRTELSTIQGFNLLYYNVAKLRAVQQGVPYQTIRDQLEEETLLETSESTRQQPGELAAYYSQKAMDEIRANWLEYAQVHLKGSLLFFVVPTAGTVARALGWVRSGTGLLANITNRGLLASWESFQAFRHQLAQSSGDDLMFFGVVGYELLFLALLNVGAVWGAIKCLRNRRWDVLLLATAIIGYFAAITGPVSYDARYRTPVVPFLALLAAVALARFIRARQPQE